MIQKKICMVGAFGVGKTSLVARFVRSIFSEKYHTTVGVKIDKKVMVTGQGEVTLVLWDLAGEDALTTVRPAHLRGSSGYILVIDGTRRDTLEVALDLQRRVREHIGEVPFVCVVNKADLGDSWEVQQADVDELAKQRWPVLKTSARSGDGVEEIFRALTEAMMQGHDVNDSKTGAVAG